MENKEKRETPLLKTINDVMRLLQAFMALVLIGYFLSGITVIAPNEAGAILRMGKLVGSTPADQVHEPGWLFALPKPFDQVIRIPVKQIQQIKVSELSSLASSTEEPPMTIDPVKEGYCISADENIFQASILVKYQISDPIAVLNSFSENYSDTLKKLINDLTVAEMTNASVHFSIDGILTEDKERLSLSVLSELQKKLTDMNSGVSVAALEIEELSPPLFLKADFEQVNEAFINKHNFISEAQSLAEEKIPNAKGKAKELIMNARTYEEGTLAEANAAAGRFEQMLAAYRSNPVEIRQEMLNTARKSVYGRAKGIMTFPSLKECQAAVRMLISSSANDDSAPLPPSDVLFEDDEP